MRLVPVSSSIQLLSHLVVAATFAVVPVFADDWPDEVPPFVAHGSQGPDHLEVTLRTYSLPSDLRQPGRVEDTLSWDVGVAGTELVGMRVILAVPSHLRFERIELEVADGLFLVQEKSVWRSAGRFVMTVARWLLIGRLFSDGEDLEVSATTWTLLLGNEMLNHESVTLDRREHTTIERDDQMITFHGRFAVCRMVMARNEVTELINITIWTTERESGRPMRFTIPRLTLPASEG